MSHTVLWLNGAEQELAELWLDSVDRDAITSAARWIDQLLETDPENEGESRHGRSRILFVAPLGVTFTTVQDDRLVFVSRVWRIAKSQ